jgi:hypothetical protein
MTFTDGVYITKNQAYIVLLSDVKQSYDVDNKVIFWVVTYEYKGNNKRSKKYKRTLLTEEHLKRFAYLGEL